MRAMLFRVSCVVLPICCLLSACGTTSSFKSTPLEQAFIDLMPFDRLLVEDFVDDATHRAKPEKQPLIKPKIERATVLFADQIVSVVKTEGGFTLVDRVGAAEGGTLVLRGTITQYDEGNASLRWIVGFAAGNVNFDATLLLVDGGSQAVLGTWIVDKNSWALGGGIAATQTPDDFMAEAARRIGTELSTARKAGKLGKQQR